MSVPSFRRGGRAAAALLCAAVAAVACDSPSAPGVREPAAIAVAAGGGQQGTAGQELPVPISVKVTDDRGRPVAGQAVTFHVTGGGGTVFSGTATTNAEGIAQERWTLGTAAGSAQTLEARVVNGSGTAFIGVVSATVTPGPVAHLDRVAPLGFAVGVVNSLLDDTLVARVTDVFGNGVAGATVSWAATAGGGSTTAAASVSDANGFARMTWTLGPPPSNGYQSASATISGMTVSFFARAAVGMLALQPNGATVNPGVPVTASVAVNDFIGPVPGLTVHWQVTSGGGTVTPAASKTGGPENPGIATAQWTPGPTPGTQTLTATAGSLSATFTVTVLGAVTRTLVAQVPGTVLDASLGSVLWLDQSGAAPAFKRRLSNGTDLTATVSPGTGQLYAVRGYLYDGGALLRTQTGQFYLWHDDGSLTPLGVGEGLPSVEGDWAAWRANAGDIVRIHLSTGSIVHIAAANATQIDVGADGDVVWLENGFAPWVYRDGTATQVTTQGDGSVGAIATDGVNIIYTKIDLFNNGTLLLDNGNADIGLAHHSSHGYPSLFAVMNGGWIAYGTPETALFRRSPGGAVQQVTPETSGVVPAAITPDGTLVYASNTTGRYYLVTPAGTRLDAGSTLGTYFLVDGPYLFAVEGGAVYRITA
ncbi:MAG TPA: Ig-like domain-containing protein [Longimicrobium sp.]|nr:Ig-like domain-containing protein [Longimicrobium sp.]